MGNMKDKMMSELASSGDDLAEVKQRLEAEIKDREKQNQELKEKFGEEVDACNQACSQINYILNAENEKRKREAEELQERLEREKRKLENYIENDN